jgi:hypothetical protein
MFLLASTRLQSSQSTLAIDLANFTSILYDEKAVFENNWRALRGSQHHRMHEERCLKDTSGTRIIATMAFVATTNQCVV